METKAATAKAMEEVGGAIVATTLVLLAVFVPTALMPGLTGRLYQQFAITISIATVFSSINALTLSPALAGLLLRPSPRSATGSSRSSTSTSRWHDRQVHGRREGAGAPHGNGDGGVRRPDGAMVLELQHDPGGFIPDEDQGYFFVNIELPDAASMERVEEVLDRDQRGDARTRPVSRTTSRSVATRS